MAKRNLTMLNWWGGKNYLLNHIYPFPQHYRFIDVFGGAGTVLINKPKCEREIYNDLNKNIFNLFKIIQSNLVEFLNLHNILGTLDSRSIFDWFMNKLNEHDQGVVELTPIQKAVAYFYVQKRSYSDMGNVYAMQHKYATKFEQIHNRIKDVTFENLSFERLLKRPYANKQDTVVYLDPPYAQGGEFYEKMQGGNQFTLDQITEMCELVSDLNSYVCISYDTDLSEELSGSKWIRKKIPRLNYSQMTKDGTKRIAYEYVITNYDINTVPRQKTNSDRSLIDFL